MTGTGAALSDRLLAEGIGTGRAEDQFYDVPQPDESGGGTGDLLAGLRTGAWLDAQTFAPLRWVVPEVIPEGTSVLAGRPKIGKSWMVLAIALAAASGGRALGCVAVDSRPVLYLALEDGFRRLQSRARSLLGPGTPIPAQLAMLTKVEPGLHAATAAEWLARHDHTSGLVIVDTLARVMPSGRSGESAYQRDHRAVAGLQSLVAEIPGAALIIVHHTRKMAAEDYVDSVSGTLGITGAADTTLVLTRARGSDDGMLQVTGRDVDEAEYALKRAPGGTWELDAGSLGAARKAAADASTVETLGDRSAEIYRLAVDSGVSGVRPPDVAAKLDISAKDAGQYLGRLAAAGKLRKIRRGVYADATLSTGHEEDCRNGEGTLTSDDGLVSTLSTVSTPHGGNPVPGTVPEDSVDSVESVEIAGRTGSPVSTAGDAVETGVETAAEPNPARNGHGAAPSGDEVVEFDPLHRRWADGYE